jgi:predicted DsbA family dithiol-disulfide isomerase
MSRLSRPLQIVVYQDVLCAWCFIAEQRLQLLQRELSGQVRWTTRPFPLRATDARPSKKEIQSWLKAIAEAKREPEGKSLRADLWTGDDLPGSSLDALAALEAARLQGVQAQHQLAKSLQRAALEQGVNVTRPDVIFEMASAVGLDMNRFAPAYQSPQARRLILTEHRLAKDRGVRGVPTIVIGGRWMICGLREVGEYRQHILDCLHRSERTPSRGADQTVH